MKPVAIKYLDQKYELISKQFSGPALLNARGTAPIPRSIFVEKIVGYSRGSVRDHPKKSSSEHFKVCPAKFEWLLLHPLGWLENGGFQPFEFLENEKRYANLFKLDTRLKDWREYQPQEIANNIETSIKISIEDFERANRAFQAYFGESGRGGFAVGQQVKNMPLASGEVIVTDIKKTADNEYSAKLAIDIYFSPEGAKVSVGGDKFELFLSNAYLFVESSQGARVRIKRRELTNTKLQLIAADDANGRSWFRLDSDNETQVLTGDLGSHESENGITLGTIEWSKSDEIQDHYISMGLGQLSACEFSLQAKNKDSSAEMLSVAKKAFFYANRLHSIDEIPLCRPVMLPKPLK